MGAEPAETGDVGASDTRVSAEEHGIVCDVADSCALSLANGELSYSAVRASKQYFTVSGYRLLTAVRIASTTRTLA